MVMLSQDVKDKEYEIEVSAQALVKLLKSQMQPKYCARELVQNSRDSGASRIEFRTGYEDGYFFFSVSDNGCGMSLSQINEYYLKLMNSSKKDMEDCVGRFGVGRISALAYEPDYLILKTCNGMEKHSLLFDENLAAKIYKEKPAAKGTEVVFLKEKNAADELNIELELYEALTETCRYVKPKLMFNREKINKKIDVSGEFKRKFKKDNYEGVLALSDKCKHTILEGGILLESGTIFNNNINLILDIKPSFGLKYPFGRNKVIRDEQFEKLQEIVDLETKEISTDICKHLNKKMAEPSGLNLNIDIDYRKYLRSFYNFLASARNPAEWKDNATEYITDFSLPSLNFKALPYKFSKNADLLVALIWGPLAVKYLIDGDDTLASIYAFTASCMGLQYIQRKTGALTPAINFIKHKLTLNPTRHVLDYKSWIGREYLLHILNNLPGRYYSKSCRLFEDIDPDLLDTKLFFDINYKKTYSMNEIASNINKYDYIYFADTKCEATDHFINNEVPVINSEKRSDITDIIRALGPYLNLNSILPTKIETNLSERDAAVLKAMHKFRKKVALGYIIGDEKNIKSIEYNPKEKMTVLNMRNEYIKTALDLFDSDPNKAIYALEAQIRDAEDPINSDKELCNFIESMI